MSNNKIILDGITANELVNQLAVSVKELLTKNEPQQVQEDEFLTRNQTKDFLQVSLVTLYHWDKKGILQPHRIGKKVRYKKSDVLNALKGSEDVTD